MTTTLTGATSQVTAVHTKGGKISHYTTTDGKVYFSKKDAVISQLKIDEDAGIVYDGIDEEVMVDHRGSKSTVFIIDGGSTFFNRKDAEEAIAKRRGTAVKRKIVKRKITKGGNTMATAAANKSVPKVLTVKAMSEAHAMFIAKMMTQKEMHELKYDYTTRNPRPAKTCKTDDYPVKGARKWITEYQVYSYGQRIALGRDKYAYTDLELVAEHLPSKTDALKEARKLAVDMQMPMTIKIVKVLEDDDNTVADVSPKTTLGEFAIRYE